MTDPQPEPDDQKAPLILVVMGVTGSGKTTVGKLVANQLGLPFHDADDYHTPESLDKLAADVPLTDADREPWLAILETCIMKWSRTSGAVLACSALKRVYRQRFREAADNVKFVYLKGDRDVIAERVAGRAAKATHVVKKFALILENQFRDLEAPDDAIVIDVHQPAERIVDQVIEKLAARTQATDGKSS